MTFLKWPWLSKMEASVDKCLAFCQSLATSGQKFSFTLSIGKDNFSFSNNKELGSSSCLKKKKSPSRIRREQRRKEERTLKTAAESTGRAGNSVYLGSGAASQKKSRSQKPKRKGKRGEKEWEKREERSRKRGVKCGRNQKKYKSPTKPDSYLIFLALLQSTSIQSIWTFKKKVAIL